MTLPDSNPDYRLDAEGIPIDCCPICTKDLELDGWCFECRTYPRLPDSNPDKRQKVDECYARLIIEHAREDLAAKLAAEMERDEVRRERDALRSEVAELKRRLGYPGFAQ